MHDPLTKETKTTPPIDYPTTTAKDIEKAIDDLLVPDKHKCGILNHSACSSSTLVWQSGSSDTFIIFFVGQRLNANVTLSLTTDSLQNFKGEIFHNETNDYLRKNNDIAYTNVDYLDVYMGGLYSVVNVRGTSASVATNIVTQEGDDKFFLSSDASEDTSTAPTVDVLYGILDYFEGELFLKSSGGRHRLLISDNNSTVPRGVGIPAELTSSGLVNLSEDIAPIHFESDNGFDDVVLWLGEWILCSSCCCVLLLALECVILKLVMYLFLCRVPTHPILHRNYYFVSFSRIHLFIVGQYSHS